MGALIVYTLPVQSHHCDTHYFVVLADVDRHHQNLKQALCHLASLFFCFCFLVDNCCEEHVIFNVLKQANNNNLIHCDNCNILALK